MSYQVSENELIDLFPAPRPIQSLDLPVPKPFPGATPASTATLREVLQDSHKRWHCFFDPRGFHNHTVHTALALWYLGADSSTIKAAYNLQCTYQAAAFASPGPINKDNWTEHLGNDKYYDAYMAFFAAEVAAKGPSVTVEEYVFSAASNFPEGASGKHLAMLYRFHEALMHPLIHVGHGFEYNLPGLIVEGLAHTTVHKSGPSSIIPHSWFENTQEAKPNSTPSALNILARVLADPEIPGLGPTPDLLAWDAAVKQSGERLSKHVEAWSPDTSTKEGLEKAFEEVAWLVSLVYAIPGLTTKEEGLFNADFFHVHYVTSSLFLSSLLVNLKPKSRELLLRSFVVFCLIWFVGRGKPQLDIESFFNDTTSLKYLSVTTFDHLAITKHDIPAASANSPNPWGQIIQEAIIHIDDHLPKLQRTLSHYAQVYGNREPGYFKDSELKGAEKIDGTLFVRAANLTSYRINNNKAGGPLPAFPTFWDRRGFYQK